MEKQQKTSSEKEAKPKKPTNLPGPGKNETEFADEFTTSDIDSAFKNPVTGEERLY